jgi:hypothetical protein
VPGALGIGDASDDSKEPASRHPGAQRIRVEAEARQRRGALTRDQKVGFAEQRHQARAPVIGLQVEPLDGEPLVHLGVPRRGEREEGITRRRLDLRDARASLPQSRGRERAGDILGDRDDSYAIEEVGRLVVHEFSWSPSASPGAR